MGDVTHYAGDQCPGGHYCDRCGGFGFEPCHACMDTGIGGDGGDCRECPPMGEPCSSCTR